MDGKTHGDLTERFPGADSARCLGDGSAEVAWTGHGIGIAHCPECDYDKLIASLRRFPPPRFRATIPLPEAVQAWAGRGRKAQGLYLAGPVGTGKTHVAWGAVVEWCIAAEVIPHGEQPATDDWLAHGRVGPNVIFTRMTDLLDDMRPGDDSRRRVRDCQNAALLVIDDVGAEKASEWTQERFYSVIDHRYAACLPLILTSNLPPRELTPQVGERAASRLAEMCEVVAMTGTDRRKPGA